MRPLALVVVVTLLGNCVPVESKAMATAGNVALLVTSTYVAQTELDRDCDDERLEQDRVGCRLGSGILIGTAEILSLVALIGLMRTLAAVSKPSTPRRQ